MSRDVISGAISRVLKNLLRNYTILLRKTHYYKIPLLCNNNSNNDVHIQLFGAVQGEKGKVRLCSGN